MKFEYVERRKIATDEEMINDLKQTARKLCLESLSMQEYDENGQYSSSAVNRRFGTWNKALEIAGLGIRCREFTIFELFENIERVWVKLGKQPNRRDMDNRALSSISSGAYLRKFGKWSDALKQFVAYINEQEKIIELNTIAGSTHKTKREVNLRMRFLVMQRDNFKCCTCGASPAKDPAVVLRIDHIKPWVKGGETTMANLQTLCSICNLGKSDIY